MRTKLEIENDLRVKRAKYDEMRLALVQRMFDEGARIADLQDEIRNIRDHVRQYGMQLQANKIAYLKDIQPLQEEMVAWERAHAAENKENRE